jgi:uncharacterized membrane protein (UPF0182 family)
MYTIFLFILLAIAAVTVYFGYQKGKATQIVLGILFGVVSGIFFGLLDFWGDMWWFDALGFTGRFWKVIFSKIGFAALGAAFGGVVVYGLTLAIPKEKKRTRIASRLVAVFIGGNWGAASWDTVLKFFNRVSTDVKDPILGADTGFYLFSLPFYDSLYNLFFLLVLVAILSSCFSAFFRVRSGNIDFNPPEAVPDQVRDLYRPVFISGAVFLFVLAWGKYLNRFHLMYSSWGAVTGAGWTDVHLRLPAYWVVALLTVLLGIVLIVAPLRKRVQSSLSGINPALGNPMGLLASTGITVAGIWVVALLLIPNFFQWLRVEPNEITFEKPYIEHNIRFTRRGFRLHEIEEREFPASGNFSRQMVEENKNFFANIRLWDWRALDAVYKQFQEIRLYYEFKDVDIDRYTIGDDYRQVMVSARELQLSNLPEESRTFVNERFKYTHGNGITLTPVSEFTPEGLPNLLIRDIPPKSTHEDLKVEKPQIYYGELTDSYVVVNTEEEELDYPSGEKNVYIHYPGKGGVQMKNLWRKLVFGWKFGGTRFLLSGYPTQKSRVMFHRDIEERVNILAPFLRFDEDPYIVLANGELYWIIDGYTMSTYYPYSEPFSLTEKIQRKRTGRRLPFSPGRGNLHRINYIRNSVKTVINAFDGSVDFYMFETDDPIIRVWNKIFPDMFKKKQDMPKELFAHVRYPADMLLTQGLVYAKYHMTDPTVFYNQEDLWIRATEKYYNEVQPVQPYYIMWELPGADEPEFVLILPFTPKNRQVMIGWIAGMCDGNNYGRFLAYKFPKEKRVLGPQQVETKIDQDRFLSGQLTLWDQRGSNVIRGNVLAIPIAKTLFYVEPIYLQAETAAYPELRLVVVMHSDNLSYGNTFDEALEGLFKEDSAQVRDKKIPAEVAKASVQSLIQKANDAFENYLDHLGGKRFDEASKALKTLQQMLEQLTHDVQSAK